MTFSLADLETALTVLSIGLAFVFFFKSRRIKQPMFSIRSAHLIRNVAGQQSDLDIRFAGEPITNLTATKIAFWNNGRETIDGRDIAQTEPLAVGIDRGLKILDAEVLDRTRPSNNFSILMAADGSEALIFFDFLDKGDGAVIQVLHTGNSSRDLIMRGVIKGARLRQRSLLPMSPESRTILGFTFRYFNIALWVLPVLFINNLL